MTTEAFVHSDPHAVEHAEYTGHDFPPDPYMGFATLGKIGMWIFLLSDALSFAGLLLAMGILRGGGEYWQCNAAAAAKYGCTPEPDLGINFTAGLTFLLICSSVTMVLAYAAAVEKNRKQTMLFLGLTALGGALFLCGQMQEYFGAFSFIFGHEGLVHEGLHFGKTHYATTFYMITSFHGMHVFTGVTYLTVMLIRVATGHLDVNHVEICGLFWHFVDLIWIIVFTLVYLIPA
jgi:heme/copper-type cytochrome/quinol oxidase subunit 3